MNAVAATQSPTPSELSKADIKNEEIMEDLGFGHRNSWCLCLPCCGLRRPDTVGWWERIKTMSQKEKEKDESSFGGKGFFKAFMKAREWSELVAGPKWKTFIRRLTRNWNKQQQSSKFGYDPLSYAMNFDEGHGQDDHEDDDLIYRDFSSRYASIPASAKSSMDLGKDGPSFV